MKASILFITYQHEAFVAEAIRSAMAQDYPDLELVVCDDGSPDRTREILERELENCPPHIRVIRAHSEKNCGFHANFNRGLAACSGDVIVAMSGDDVSLPHRVSSICSEFAADPSSMLVCTNWIRIDDSGRETGIRGKRRENGIFSYTAAKDSVYAGAPLCGAVAAYRASLLDLFPPMEQGRHAEDNCFWVRALLVGNIRYLSDPLVFWRSHGDNQSNWERGLDTKSARDKHLKFLHAHQCMARQWRRDLSHALATNLISKIKYQQLQLTIEIQREWHRLLRLSVAQAPWGLWLGSVSKLLWASAFCWSLRKSASKILRKHLQLRISVKRRNEYWHSYFNGKAA
jgi:glycosyltransferase involved in cell wall biosynthesis